MKLIKINNCRECPYHLKDYACKKVIVETKYPKTCFNHWKKFTRIERRKNYIGFLDWCPLEDCEVIK